VPSCGAPRRLAVHGLELALHAWGGPGAPPALLLHSLAAHAHWWDAVAPRLAERLHVVALDFRGHGASAPSPGGAYAFADHVADVEAVVAALGWTEPPLVVGHSMGGYVAALLAATHPSRVRRLVVADVLTGWSDAMDARARAQASRPGPVFASAAEAGARFRLAPPETTAPADLLRHLGEAGVVERRPGAWEHAFDRRVFLHPAPDPWPFLPRVACPTLVVRGELSPVMDGDAAARFAAAVAHGRVAEIAGAHHHLVLDAPDGFASLVLRWLADGADAAG
jgi:pimeloyl-ACP methyl ester carboxylesterase